MKEECELNIGAADTLMGIFGYTRTNMDKTICLGIGCKVKKSCWRYGVKADDKWQSYMAACKNKVSFIGKKRK